MSSKCFPDTGREYWDLLAAATRGDIVLTEAGKEHILARHREWGDLVLYGGMPEYDWDEK